MTKKLDDILRLGFDLDHQDPDGSKTYVVKYMHSVYYDYFEVNYLYLQPDGRIDLSIGINGDPFDGADELDEFHVYKLTELI